MPSARTIKARNGIYYKSNAENIRSSEPLVSNIVLIQSPKTEPLVSNISLIQSAKVEPLVSNIGLIQSAKGESLVSNIGLIQSPKGELLVSNIVLIQSPKREPLVSNIIIILGETRLPHSLAKPDCYARINSGQLPLSVLFARTYRPPYFRGNSKRNVQLRLSELLLRA